MYYHSYCAIITKRICINSISLVMTFLKSEIHQVNITLQIYIVERCDIHVSCTILKVRIPLSPVFSFCLQAGIENECTKVVHVF